MLGFLIFLAVMVLISWLIQIVVLWANACTLNEARAKKGTSSPYGNSKYYDNIIKQLWWVKDKDFVRAMLTPFGFVKAMMIYIRGQKTEE